MGANVETLEQVMRRPRGPRERLEATTLELARRFAPELGVRKLLLRIGIRARDADRWLARRVVLESAGLGESWLAMELAKLTASDPERVRAAHREGGLDVEAADAALELARTLVLAREALRDPSLAERVRERVVRAEPERVRVWIDAPRFVDASAWASPGEEVPAHRARWLLHEVDGLVVGGVTLRVRTEPSLRAGRKPARREDRRERARRIFSRRGVRSDEEGWWSATPEAIALQMAEGARGVVIDGTCGIGALAIAFARQPGVEKVIAIDRDEARLAMARHNARTYDVEHKIHFVIADLERAELRGDVLVIDPPWGGREYDRERVTLDDLPLDLRSVLARFDGEVILKLPRSFDPSTLPGEGWSVRARIDERGIVKLLEARRAGR